METLILATQSPYKQQLFARLQLPFRSANPSIDESPLANETPVACAQRLALNKAQVIAAQNPQAIVIGCDQLAICEQQFLSKPGGHANAVAQLQQLSGKQAWFYTAVAVVKGTKYWVDMDTFCVQYQDLTLTQIENYLSKEPAYDCVGSCKSEGLGIALCAALQGNDPTSLVGLPLILTIKLLAMAGITVL
jgi:septum formation protein